MASCSTSLEWPTSSSWIWRCPQLRLRHPSYCRFPCLAQVCYLKTISFLAQVEGLSRRENKTKTTTTKRFTGLVIAYHIDEIDPTTDPPLVITASHLFPLCFLLSALPPPPLAVSFSLSPFLSSHSNYCDHDSHQVLNM